MDVAHRSAQPRLLEPDLSQGWRKYSLPQATIWFSGHLYSHLEPRNALAAWPSGGDEQKIARFLDGLDGHFALICKSPDSNVTMAVDPVRSIPLYFAEDGSRTALAASSEDLRRSLGLTEIDADSAVAVAMAGYTIGVRTLFRGLEQLGPGEFLIARSGAAPRRARYHRYSPWLVKDDDDTAYEKRLADMTLSLTERMVRQTNGRLIVLPLSAGRDSRLLVSALAEVGARNVVCFSYGFPGNHEAEAGRKISAHLGYPWHLTPFTLASQRKFLRSDLNARYQKFADSNCSTTVVHDLPAIQQLLDRGVIDRQAIVVNGNSGDYITGLHIQPPVNQGLPDMTHEQRVDVVIATILKKHFRLWQSLATPANDQIVAAQLRSEINLLGVGEVSAEQAHGLYEYLEFQDRQSKYVISRQRIYEFLDLEWRLPLWSRDYLDFWQPVPLRLKRGQSLYARMLKNRNWGGVWQGSEWHFPSRVSPPWMRWGVRPLARALCLPFGRSAWEKFERHFLRYWTDLLAYQAIEPYRRVALDRRGGRHFVAWHTEAYLRRKGLRFNGWSN